MRTIDDRVIHALNTSIPTNSFASTIDASSQCKQLYEQLLLAHQGRETAIKHCINETSTNVEILRKQRDSNADDVQLVMNLRKQQSMLRMYQREMNVEEVVKDTTTKVFYERCRLHYTPEESQT